MRSGSFSIAVTVYYFPGNNKFPFGHIAIGGFGRIKELAPEGYLSYGLGQGHARDMLRYTEEDGRTFDFPLTLAGENETYTGSTPIVLPACDRDKFMTAIQHFGERKREDYSVFSNNCANAVLAFLKDIDLIKKDATFLSPVRPQAIALQACDIVLASIKTEREAILAEKNTPPFTKIEALIENDIKRLKTQQQRDEIDHFSFYKNSHKKTEKIKVLEKLSEKIAEAKLSRDPDDFQACYRAIREAENIGSTKTKHNLEKCLALVPQEYVATSPMNIVKDYAYYIKERESILEDDVSPIEKLKSLIQNDIHRLDAKGAENKKHFFTSHDSSIQKKSTKIFALTILLSKMQDPINYSVLLDALETAAKEKSMHGETSRNLEDCIAFFPYEKLSAIPSMRDFCIKFDLLLTDKKDTALTYRAMIPAGEEAICSMDEKTVYHAFTKVAEKLAYDASVLRGSSPKDAQSFISTFNEMAHAVVKTDTSLPKAAGNEARSSPRM
jgi:hypothetical protein